MTVASLEEPTPTSVATPIQTGASLATSEVQGPGEPFEGATADEDSFTSPESTGDPDLVEGASLAIQADGIQVRQTSLEQEKVLNDCSCVCFVHVMHVISSL